jgi:flagellar biosynthetic protein FliQ
MTSESVIDLSQQAIKLTLMLSGPMMLGALFVGLIISLFQALTQINEQTLATIPKIVAIFILLVISGPWLVDTMTNFTEELITSIPSFVQQQ